MLSHKIRVWADKDGWRVASADKLFVTAKGLVRLAEIFAQWDDTNPGLKSA
jgi:hypothetical protein